MINLEEVKSLKKEGDKFFKKKDYVNAINKYWHLCDYKYYPEVENRLMQIARYYMGGKISRAELPDNETLINLGYALLGNHVLSHSELKYNEEKLAYTIFKEFIPYRKLPKEVRMWINKIGYINIRE